MPLERMIDVGRSEFAREDFQVPIRAVELCVKGLSPRSFPIKLKPIDLKVVSYQFPKTTEGIRVFRSSGSNSEQADEWYGHTQTGLPDRGSRYVSDKPIPNSDKSIFLSTLTERRTGPCDKAQQSVTRFRPPEDAVKIEDRLFYLLQPPLEQLVRGERLDFPFDPFPYQLDGIAFLFPRHAAVLADEMGLGKTMQAITAIRLLLCCGELRNVLLVCPKPLVSNWLREFSTWAPEVPVVPIQGSAATRVYQWGNNDIAVRIANYEVLMRDRDVLLEINQNFDLVVLDEAQRIKNTRSTTSQIVRAISRKRSWALTGTPVENSQDDLVGIFEFVSPGCLRPEMSMSVMAKSVRECLLRRTKDMVLEDMPPKLYRDAELELTPEQQLSYEKAETEGVVRLESLDEQLTIQHVFELVLRLKQICNFDPVTGSSAKLERLVADMEEVAASGQKAILFSQWVNTIALLRPAMERFGVSEYHGKVPSSQRETVIQQFKEDPSKHLIMMSYGSGSVGLNLQFCRYVFLFDRWWNPAVEDQAINRAHRVGAAGSVTVTRMLTYGTIEQKIAAVLEQKRQIFNELFSDLHEIGSIGLSQSEVFGLFNLKGPSPRHS